MQDPILLQAEKIECLRNWLARRNVPLDNKSLKSLIVFSNRKAAFDNGLKATAGLSRIYHFGRQAIELCGLPKKALFEKREAGPVNFEKACEALNQLPTWDRVELHGGRVLQGDLDLLVNRGTDSLELRRSQLKRMTIRKARWVFLGFVIPARLRVRDWSGQKRSLPLHPEAKIVFQPAGHADKEEISVLDVKTLRLGWKDHSYYD